MNVLVDMRNAGAIGFSPIAEAYRNFGVAGVLLIMGFTGWFIGKLDQLPRTGAWPAMVGLVMIPQLIQVRNSFIHVPFSTLAGVIVLLGTILYFDRLAGKRNHDEPQQRQRERPVA